MGVGGSGGMVGGWMGGLVGGAGGWVDGVGAITKMFAPFKRSTNNQLDTDDGPVGGRTDGR